MNNEHIAHNTHFNFLELLFVFIKYIYSGQCIMYRLFVGILEAVVLTWATHITLDWWVGIGCWGINNYLSNNNFEKMLNYN